VPSPPKPQTEAEVERGLVAASAASFLAGGSEMPDPAPLEDGRAALARWEDWKKLHALLKQTLAEWRPVRRNPGPAMNHAGSYGSSLITPRCGVPRLNNGSRLGMRSTASGRKRRGLPRITRRLSAQLSPRRSARRQSRQGRAGWHAARCMPGAKAGSVESFLLPL
jgi:hypothetical protein